jgi:hypothetical protein
MTAKTVVAKARTAADYKSTHEKSVIVPNKIKAGLAALLKTGPEHYEYDEGFRSLCGLQAAELAEYREAFKSHWFITPGRTSNKGGKRVWFGNAKVAARLRPINAQE